MAQRVRRGGPLDAGTMDGALECALERLLVDVMTADQAGARIDRDRVLRERPEPGPRGAGARVFAIECIGHEDAAAAGAAVVGPQQARFRELLAKGRHERGGQHDDAILGALPFAHDDGVALEIDVLHAQAKAFHDAHSGAVEKLREDAMRRVDEHEQARHFMMREHHGQAHLRLRAADLGQPRQIEPEHLLIEKDERRQRLLVRGHRDPALARQP